MIVSLLDVILFSTYFILLFLATFWLLVLFTPENKPKKNKMEKKPFFTAIVPAYNEEKSIGETIKSLMNLDYPNDKIEIIVINDGSTDSTQQIVEQIISLNPLKSITLINQKNQGKGKALNVGLEIARGEYYACLDADSFIDSNALQVMLPYFLSNNNLAAVCPLLKVKKPENMLQKVQWYEYIINMFYKDLNSKINCIHVTPGPFSVYRTDIIKKLGGYDETTITEDLEIAIRLQKHHYEIKQTFDTTVETVSPRKWKDLFRQRIRWYKGSVDNAIVYKKLMFNKNYGDFGMIRMPTIILSGIIAITLCSTIFYEIIKQVSESFYSLKAINFDIITLIKNYSPNFNILGLPFAKLLIAGTLIIITLFIMIYSFKIVKEKIRNYGKTWISMFTYIFIYSMFISVVWVYIAFMIVTKKKNFWS